MVVAVLGETDKRPVIYCLMKLFQTLGSAAVFTADRHYKRLIDNGTNIGHYQNIFIAVTDASSDEIFQEIGYNSVDFEHIIYDCVDQVPDYFDELIYVGGAGGPTEEEQIILDMYPTHKRINLGFGEKNIPYSIDMFKVVEQVEGLKHLGPQHPQISQRIATIVSERLKMPVKNILKVVSAK